MKDFIRMLAVIASGVLAGCGGTGAGAAENPAAGGSAPAPIMVAGAWDSWNWDEGGFSE
jgi:hypothetical protein